MGRISKRHSGGLTPDEEQELARLETRCRELEEHKGITDTIHHDRRNALRLKAEGAPIAKETTTDGTDS